MLHFKNGVSVPFEVRPSLAAQSPLLSNMFLLHLVSSRGSLCACSAAKLCLTLCNPMDCSPAGSPVYGIFQARILEWVAISFSWGSFQPRDQTRTSCASCIAGGVLTTVPPSKPNEKQHREVIRSTLEPHSLGSDSASC